MEPYLCFGLVLIALVFITAAYIWLRTTRRGKLTAYKAFVQDNRDRISWDKMDVHEAHRANAEFQLDAHEYAGIHSKAETIKYREMVEKKYGER